MEDLKKRKVCEKGVVQFSHTVSEEQLRLLLDPLAKSQLVDLLAKLMAIAMAWTCETSPTDITLLNVQGSQYPSISEEIQSLASADPVHRKLFVRGLSWNTTSETLRSAFEEHGEIEEGAVIIDKATGKSRGFGFITYFHMESTNSALKAPSKLIDGRLAVCNLACEAMSGVGSTSDVAQRKLFIGGLSPETTTEVLLKFFARHGQIEEGSVTYDKDTNESRGFGFVTFKTMEAARKAIDDPQKILGGRNLLVKIADSHKNKMVQTQQVASAVNPMAIPMVSAYAPQSQRMEASAGFSYPPHGIITQPTFYGSNAHPYYYAKN